MRLTKKGGARKGSGRPSKGGTVMVGASLPPIVAEALSYYAATNHYSKSWVVEDALREYLKQRGVTHI